MKITIDASFTVDAAPETSRIMVHLTAEEVEQLARKVAADALRGLKGSILDHDEMDQVRLKITEVTVHRVNQ